MLKKFKNIMTSEKGQGLTEYGLIIALIAVVCIGALLLLGPAVAQKFIDVKDEIENAQPMGG